MNISIWVNNMSKSRQWMIIVYPESAIENWQQYLKDMGIKGAVSPLHDSDLRDDGKLKKPHYHTILLFNGGRTETYIRQEIVEPIKALGQFQRVIDKQLAFEYLTHENDPDKFQYDKAKIEFINSSVSDFVNEDYISIIDYIDDNKIKSLVGLLKSLRKTKNKRLIQYVSNNTFYVTQYLKEVRQDYDSKVETLVKQMYNHYGDVRINKDVLNKLCEVFNEVKIDNEI